MSKSSRLLTGSCNRLVDLPQDKAKQFCRPATRKILMEAAERSQTICQNMVFVFLEAHHILHRTRTWGMAVYTPFYFSDRMLFPPLTLFFLHMELIKIVRLVNARIAQLESCFQVRVHWKNSVIKHQPGLLPCFSELFCFSPLPKEGQSLKSFSL